MKPSVGGACDATSNAAPPPKTILISDPRLLPGRNRWEGAEGTGSACLGLVMSGVHCQGAGKQLKLPTRLPACQFAGLILPAVECHCSGASCSKFRLGVGGGKPDLELGSARLPLSDAGQLWLPSMHGLRSAFSFCPLLLLRTPSDALLTSWRRSQCFPGSSESTGLSPLPHSRMGRAAMAPAWFCPHGSNSSSGRWLDLKGAAAAC